MTARMPFLTRVQFSCTAIPTKSGSQIAHMTGLKDIVQYSAYSSITLLVYTTTNRPSGFGKLRKECMSAREV